MHLRPGKQKPVFKESNMIEVFFLKLFTTLYPAPIRLGKQKPLFKEASITGYYTDLHIYG